MGWPPRPQQASPYAREEQTLTVYRGELFAGVWPWGEVWRLDREAPGEARWHFLGRMFTQPEIDPGVTEPYVPEVKSLGEKVWNIWGQRVTGLVPRGNALYISTGSKGGTPVDLKFGFLGEVGRREYGAVLKLTMDGHLSAHLEWTEAPTELELELVVTDEVMRIWQDGRVVGSCRRSAGGNTPSAGRISWGRGIHGPFSGKILQRRLGPR